MCSNSILLLELIADNFVIKLVFAYSNMVNPSGGTDASRDKTNEILTMYFMNWSVYIPMGRIRQLTGRIRQSKV